MKQERKIYFVMPAYNEGANIEAVVSDRQPVTTPRGKAGGSCHLTLPRGSGPLFHRREIALRHPAEGAQEVIGQILEGRAGSYALVRHTLRRVINPAADVADVLLLVVFHNVS